MKGRGFWAGISGSLVGLCCAGTATVLSFLSSVGLGFMINDVILFPLMFLFFAVVSYSLYANKKDHGNQRLLYFSLGSMALILMGIFYQPIIWLGILGLISVALWDVVLCRKCIENGKEKSTT